MSASVVALLCRTSDRTPGGARGAEALAPRLARLLGVEPRMVGTAGDARPGGFADDLRESRGCLLEAGGQVDDALEFLHHNLTLSFSTEDIQEGVKAFFEKREPQWSGR